MPRRREPTAAETLEHTKAIGNVIFGGLSPGVKTGLMAIAVFLSVVAIFAPRKTPAYYTGCELKGAIERCAEFAAEVTKWSNVPLPQLDGEPSRADQIKALTEQDEWLGDKLAEERANKTSAEWSERIRRDYSKRGVKD